MTGECVRNLGEMPQAVVAAVNGVAAGAGAVLAAASDIRVLAESASFRFLFTSVGLSGGDMGICWLLPMSPPERPTRSEEHTSELQSQSNIVCRLLLEKKKQNVHISAQIP